MGRGREAMLDVADEAEMLDTPGAGRVLGLDPRTIACWRSRQHPEQPPYFRIGRTIRYRRQDLEEYLQQRRVFAGGPER